MSMFHKDAPAGDIHQLHQWTYGDATAKAAATGFVSSDVGKVALQVDTATYYILTDYSPITWQKIGDGTAGSLTGTVAIASGGTGQTTQQAAMDALAGTQSAGKYLRSDGTHTTLDSIHAADVPTLNQSTTGTAANVTGIVAIANGGTGQTGKTAAFDALSPNTTKGDVAVHNGTNNVRVGVGTNGQVLTADSAQATGVKWANPGAGTAPKVTTYTSGSGTHTLTGSPLYIRVRMVGGGAGGAGSTVAGGAGGTTTFGTSLLTANGGGTPSPGSTSAAGGPGGTATIGTGASGTAVQGASGTFPTSGSNSVGIVGGHGGSSPFGGAGTGGYANTGGSASANSGSGGGGSGATGTYAGGGGGGAGGYVDAIITSPSSSYSYAVGAAGTAGGSGGGYGGGSGGSGYIEVTEYYQ